MFHRVSDALLYYYQLVQLSSIGGIPPASEFFVSYGRYSNAKLLYSYGFVLPVNPINCELLPWLRLTGLRSSSFVPLLLTLPPLLISPI